MLPQSLGKLEKLTELRAADCSLTRIPAKLWGCAVLAYLDLARNALKSLDDLDASGNVVAVKLAKV